MPLEISRNGVFAIGDVPSGSVKRVAAAGDGAQVVASLHACFAKPGSRTISKPTVNSFIGEMKESDDVELSEV